MAVTLDDGPVGTVKDQRWRTGLQRVRNSARDQTKVIELLWSIPESQGGKGGGAVAKILAGPDGECGSFLGQAIWDFQSFWKAKGVFKNIDGVVDPGGNTIRKLNELAGGGVVPPAPATFICGPDVTEQIVTVWSTVQRDFRNWTFRQKIAVCNKLFLPFKRPDDSVMPKGISFDELKKQVQKFADIDTFDTLPLFQGNSKWLRSPPVFDRATNGPCATPSSSNPDGDEFDPGHEDPATCSNTVQVKGKCWLNGTVNYGTYGVMVRLCSDFARTHPAFIGPQGEGVREIYSLAWAKTLIRAYKKFGQNPEGAVLPVAWTDATFHGGPRGVPDVAGNRPKCLCTCGCKGDVVKWDYVWEPIKTRMAAIPP